MTYRIFNLKNKEYCGENFFVGQNGEILKFDSIRITNGFIENLETQDFTVEPSTGFIVESGRKIFVGDILRLDCFSLDYEVVWKEDRFMLKALYEEVNELPHYFPNQKQLMEGWVLAGTIHDKNAV